MFETKTRDDILLEERIAKIDDINFGKIYNLEEFAEKQIEDNNLDTDFLENDEKESVADVSKNVNNNAFEIEIQTNEFLDNFNWKNEEEPCEVKHEKKFFLDKLLLYTFTSIAALLSILLIYNVFVINSLSLNLKNAQKLKVENAYSVSNDYEIENDYILFENSSKMEIEKFF